MSGQGQVAMHTVSNVHLSGEVIRLNGVLRLAPRKRCRRFFPSHQVF